MNRAAAPARLWPALGCVLCFVSGISAAIDFAALLDQRWETSYYQIQQEMSRYPKVSDGGDMRRVWSSEAGPVDVILRRTQALLDEIDAMPTAPSMDSFRQQLNTYTSQAAGNATNKALFKNICALRREIAMSNPLIDFDSLIFCAFESGKPQFHSQQLAFYAKNDPGAGLYMVSGFKGASPVVKDMLENAVVTGGEFQGKKLVNSAWGGKAGYFTPTLHYDAKKMMFAWAPYAADVDWSNGGRMNPDAKFRVFEMNLDGSNLRPIGNHVDPWDDYDPLYLPNGRILIVSDRHNGGQRCGPSAISGNMYTMKPDGSDFYRISWHETNERNPTMTNDGQIVYSRWDYIDRHAYSSQSMWLMNPDGSNPRAWHGMYTEDDKPFHPISECHVMPIPNTTGKFVAIEAGHHYAYLGNLVVIDINKRARYEEQIRWFWPGWRLMGDQGHFNESERYKVNKRMFTTPRPLSEDYVIVCEFSEILLVDKFRNEIMLFDTEPLFNIKVASPIPVKPTTPPPVIQPVTYQGERRAQSPRAVISVMNVYESDFDWPQGTKITHLRICQILGRPKEPWNTRRNVWLGWSDGALLKAVIGTVPVEDDGSAYFEAPIEREIFFQAVDSTGMAVQSMLSGTYVHPGEHLTCIGCHEDKWTAAEPGYTPKALQRAPSTIAPEVDGSMPLTYHRLAKPVFESRCQPCHENNYAEGAIRFDYWDKNKVCSNNSGGEGWAVGDLEDYITYYNAAYDKAYCARDDGRGPTNVGLFLGFPGNPRSRSIAGNIGARACSLLSYIDGSHKNVDLSYEEFHRITLWLDLNAQEMGTYEINADDPMTGEVRQRQEAGEIVWPEWEGGSGVDPNNPTGVQLEYCTTCTTPYKRVPVERATVRSAPFLRIRNGALVAANLPNGRVEIAILSLSGRVVARRVLNGHRRTSPVSIPVSARSAGMYVVSVNSSRQRWSSTVALSEH